MVMAITGNNAPTDHGAARNTANKDIEAGAARSMVS
ncbi:hypothetical protein THAOC_18598, partial [Thalassiosira oceanica]